MSESIADAATLEGIAADIEKTAQEEVRAAETVREIADERQENRSWREITSDGTPKAVLALLGTSLQRLRSDTGALRRLVMKGLSEEGLTVRQIGELFRVSHQRISAIIGGRNKS